MYGKMINAAGTSSGGHFPRNDSEVYADLSGIRIRIDEAKYSPVILEALKNGRYEASERGAVPHLFTKGDRIIEIGSATGAVTMTAARVVGTENIIGFEANPSLVEDCRANFVANGMSIDVRNAVLMNRVAWLGDGTELPFYIHKQFWASSLEDKPGTETKISVPTACFETVASEFGANSLICDIEGGEIELFKFADLSNISKILIEIHYWAGRKDINMMIRKFIFDGFSINFEFSGRSIVCLHRGLSWTYV
jgi:FkbM family methyltransferase